MYVYSIPCDVFFIYTLNYIYISSIFTYHILYAYVCKHDFVCVFKIYIFIYLFTKTVILFTLKFQPSTKHSMVFIVSEIPHCGGIRKLSHEGVFKRPKKKDAGNLWGFCVLVRNILESNKAEGSPRSKHDLVFGAMPNHMGMAKHLLSAYNFYGLLLNLWESFVSSVLVISEGIETWDTSVGKTLG